jgi:hypothetical protein
MLDRRAVRGVDLARVVTTASQSPKVIVGEVRHQSLQPRVWTEEVFAPRKL